jgi:hypothetical protein
VYSGDTVAVKVTGCPATDVLVPLDTEVCVDAWFTVSNGPLGGLPPLELGSKSEFPRYFAVMTEPAVLEHTALELISAVEEPAKPNDTSGPEPATAPLLMSCTVPVGTAVPIIDETCT